MNPAGNHQVQVYDLGLMDYQEAWDYQTFLFQQTVDLKIRNRKSEEQGEEQVSTPNYLLLVEHPHVYTLGKSGQAEHLLVSEKRLRELKATYYPINRGGDITYHGPGQLVVYPILDLAHFFTDIHKYMRYMEEVIIQVCKLYKVEAGREPGQTGVWIPRQEGPPAKICAMGVKTSRWVTMHGLAFNVSPDLAYFQHIVPCGIADKPVTSLEREIGKKVPMAAVKEAVLQAFAQQFEMEFIPAETKSLDKTL